MIGTKHMVNKNTCYISKLEILTYSIDLHNPDDHDGVIIHLEPDILECEVKWALGGITTNKASGAISNPKR